MSKQDRVAPRTAADIESKYNFGKSFAEVMGIATDAKDAADKAAKAAVGTNLLTGTKDFSGSDWHNLNMWSVDGTYRGLTVMTRIGAWQGMKQLLYAEVGETYTVSAYVKSSGSFAFHFCIGNAGTGYATPGTRSYEAKTEWTRVSDTFTVTTAGIIAPGYEGTAGSTQLWICGMKLEKGTRATEWCPATVETSVSHESVFNALTDNGKMQGVYRGDDGQIYINASYIKAGELLADLIKTGTIKSADGSVQFDLSNGAITVYSADRKSWTELNGGTITCYEIDGSGNTVRSLYIAPRVEAITWIVNDGTPGGILLGSNKGPTVLGTTGTETDIMGSEINFSGKANFPGEVYFSGQVNVAKKVLFEGIREAGASFDVPNTDKYDLFAINLYDTSTDYDTTVLAYKSGNCIRGIGGWCGTKGGDSYPRQIYYVSATFSGNTWTLQDAGVNNISTSGNVGAGERIPLLSIKGVI